MDQQKRLLAAFHLKCWTSPALQIQMKRPSQSSGVLHYHRSDLLAIDIPAHINDSISLFPVHCSPDQLTVQYMTVLFHFATPNFLFFSCSVLLR
ncbi:hypothetical protein ASL71_04090 [Salmonella enterica subsp. enterica serovar Isangi]|uniref:Uncharacterized protein n=3 Tax=Salmonella enterica I TaxID=59201 RepID=A0A3U6NH19_SALET|nr:hypothetical protein [Salmonella enterica subsp. enterica serovar Bareilly]EAA5943838.1 hypothetical protein [Salmonella enterica subsp. enterica serovar Isangi]EAA7585871.1 hypothetical protein [Salmonella enterica]EBH8215629.1 hypothetical protein [Salmonella enterica subsp. enterica serovar Bareilly str. CFSAN000189]ECG1713708.1 hypothetical protein [Salmonella enterica subsp. enterica]